MSGNPDPLVTPASFVSFTQLTQLKLTFGQHSSSHFCPALMKEMWMINTLLPPQKNTCAWIDAGHVCLRSTKESLSFSSATGKWHHATHPWGGSVGIRCMCVWVNTLSQPLYLFTLSTPATVGGMRWGSARSPVGPLCWVYCQLVNTIFWAWF